jgi:hypothetical protein
MIQVQFPDVVICDDSSSGEEDADVEQMVAAPKQQVDDDLDPTWHIGELGYQFNETTVSNFVTLQWFGHRASPPDFRHHVADAFPLAAGARIAVVDPGSGQGWQQVNARAPAGLEAALLSHSPPCIDSRRERRFVGRTSMVRSRYEPAPSEAQ